MTKHSIKTSIAPWLSVRNSREAVQFYKTAFGAAEVYRLDFPDGLVARLSVDGAQFWVADEPPEHVNGAVASRGGGTVRMILTVVNPDDVFAQALSAGASEIFPVGEEHGWRVGRLVDPYGHHWEIGFQLSN
jgi:PhnB protein